MQFVRSAEFNPKRRENMLRKTALIALVVVLTLVVALPVLAGG
jgi:hypothetical protein